MIVCNKCNFEVPSSLKYSIMNNLCPACGHALFSNSDLSKIRELSDMLRGQDFSRDMSEVIINDISLFIYEILKSSLELKPDGVDNDKLELSNSNEDAEVEAEASSSDSGELERIRDEVRVELSESIESNNLNANSALQDEDDDYKIARLKRLARESSLSSGRPLSVRRVTKS